MRKIIPFVLAAITCMPAVAQDSLNLGSVTVNQDPKFELLLQDSNTTPQKSDSVAVSMPGYRVQVFSNNNPRKAKTDAFALEKSLKAEYPDVNIYVSYTAPFWKVRMGDFTNYYEALTFARKLSNDKPKMAAEIFVMKEDAVKPVYINLKGDSATHQTKTRLKDKLQAESTQEYYHY